MYALVSVFDSTIDIILLIFINTAILKSIVYNLQATANDVISLPSLHLIHT